MKLFFPQQAALQAVDHGKNLGVSHFCSKRKRPPVKTGGRDLSSFSE
jgi:hypothetical protein